MRFAALQGDFGRSVLARHPQLRGIDSLVVVEPAAAGRPERILTRSDGALRIASYLGGAWRLLAVLRIIPRPLRDVLYDAFARVRYRLFGRLDVCAVPPPEFRGRFVT